MIAKNRQGSNFKLNTILIREIKNWFGYAPSRTVAKLYNVEKITILNIWNEKYWN